MIPPTAPGPSGGLAAQLMVGPGQEAHFGQDGILRSLETVLDTLPLRELMFATTDPRGPLARKVVEACSRKAVPVALWTMVLADRDLSLPVLPTVQDAAGLTGYGSLGAWECLGQGEEKFLFACPSAVLEDEAGPAAAVRVAQDLGAAGLFLDRVRLPSPANGLEFLASCGCPRCRDAYRAQTGASWPDLVALVRDYARQGSDGVAPFLREAGPALGFRSSQVTAVVARYSRAARRAGLRVGLDLFAPSLQPLVAQDYRSLGAHADFIKPMLYCHARGPAGLPLEHQCFLRGLEAVGASAGAALEFAAGLTGLAASDLAKVRSGAGFPASVAALEYERAQRALGGLSGPVPMLYAGIELVDHPEYTTRIDREACAAYLGALRGLPLAVCWNILYVPQEHLQAVARIQGTHP